MSHSRGQALCLRTAFISTSFNSETRASGTSVRVGGSSSRLGLGSIRSSRRGRGMKGTRRKLALARALNRLPLGNAKMVYGRGNVSISSSASASSHDSNDASASGSITGSESGKNNSKEGRIHARWAVRAKSWRPDVIEWEAALSLLTPTEREKVSRLQFFEDARARVLGQLLIRYLGSQLPNVSVVAQTPLAVERLASGRPVIIGGPEELQFSVAHDGDWVMLQASTYGGLVGLDIIQTSRDTQLQRLKTVFTEYEWKQVRNLGSSCRSSSSSCCSGGSAFSEAKATGTTLPQRLGLMRRWAVKEAVVKALGVGIKFGMGNVEVDLEGEPLDENYDSRQK